MGIKKNIFKQGLYNTILLYMGSIFGVFNTILKARAITAEEIGVLAIITSLTSIVSAVMTMGIPHAVRMFYNRVKENNSEKCGFIVFTLIVPVINFIIISILFVILRHYILGIYDNELFTRYFDFLFWFFFGSNFATIIKYIFESEYRSIIANIYYDFIWRITHLVFLLIMLNYPVSFYYYLLFNLISIYLRVIVYFYYFKEIDFSFNVSFAFINKSFLKEFFKYSLITFISGLTGIMTETVDKLMIGYYLNMSDVGYYAIIAQMSVLIKMIAYGFNRVTFPLTSEYLSKGETGKVKKLYKQTSSFQLYLGIIVFLVIINFPSQILSILGKGYTDKIWIMYFLCSGYLFDLSSGNNSAIILYSKHYHYDLVLRTIEVLITVLTNIIFIPIYGVAGAAFATFLAFLSFNLMKILLVWVKFKFLPYSFDTVKLGLLFAVFYLLVKIAANNIKINNIFEVFVFSIILFIAYTLTGIYVMRIKILKNYKTVFKKM